MPLNMPGHVSCPAVLGLIDELLNDMTKGSRAKMKTLIENDLGTTDPLGIRAFFADTSRDGVQERAAALASTAGVTNYPNWEGDLLTHIDAHWYSDKGSTYFRVPVSTAERIRILSQGYLDALDIAMEGEGRKIVSYNVCAGHDFEFFILGPRVLSTLSETNQVTCLLMTGPITGKAALPPVPLPKPDPNDPRQDGDLLEVEPIRCISTNRAADFTVTDYAHQGKREEDIRDGISRHTPWRIKLKHIDPLS